MPSNQAAFLPAKRAVFKVGSAPYTTPGEDEIVVKNGAVAVNPADYIKQDTGDMMFSWIKYPFILGSDVAGKVVEVGKGDAHFKAGDRVVGHAVGTDQRSNKSSEGAFQQYTVLRTNLASRIPDSLSYEKACVLPLGMSTAACGLFMKDYLALEYPTTSSKHTGKTLLVWGASSSVGCNAVQLAKAAGYEVIATASPRNHEYVKKLGASKVFDYKSATVDEDIISTCQGKTMAGAFAIGDKSTGHCIDILAACQGRRFIAQASIDLPAGGFPKSFWGMPSFAVWMGCSIASTTVKSKMKRVELKFIWGSDLMANEVGNAVYRDFLPTALAEGKYIAAPEPQIAGKGLEHIQEAMELSKQGVSAKKLVVTL